MTLSLRLFSAFKFGVFKLLVVFYWFDVSFLWWLLQKLVRLTGGDIVVDSEEGEGSVFKFSLVLPTSGQRGDLQKLSFAMTRTPSGFGDERIRGIRVLLVDANPVRQVLFGELVHPFSLPSAGLCQSDFSNGKSFMLK